MHKPEEKGDSYHMICGTDVTYHHTCCCIAKLYIQLVLSTSYQDGTSANREPYQCIQTRRHCYERSLSDIHSSAVKINACFHGAHYLLVLGVGLFFPLELDSLQISPLCLEAVTSAMSRGDQILRFPSVFDYCKN